MSVIDFLKETEVGNYTLLQLVIILIAIGAVVYVAFWIVGEINKPPPEIVDGVAQGFFDGTKYGFMYKQTSQSLLQRRCFNNSWLYFWGNITYDNGISVDVSHEGRRIDGLICIKSVNSIKWQSSDASSRTDITFVFRGTVSPIAVIDLNALIREWWGLIPLTVLIYLFYFRKYIRKKFDAMDAIAIFEDYKEKNHLVEAGKIHVEPLEVIGGKVFRVGQLIKGAKRNWLLILEIDNHRNITRIRPDELGDVWGSTFGKEGREYTEKLREQTRRYTASEVYDVASRMVQEKKRKEPKRKTLEEKERYIAKYQSEEAPSKPGWAKKEE